MPMPLVSGFVAFDDAPRVRVSRPAAPAGEAVAERSAGADVASVAPASAGLFQSPSWQPASSGRVRLVEGAVIAALCGWFFYGGLAVLGWV